MNLAYEDIEKWLDTYFEDVNRQQGPIETVPNLRKYFTPDFEFWMYTGRASMKRPLSRDELLMLFVHPGLHEALTPQYYVVDEKRMIVVVQFEIRFVDQSSGKAWPPKQASAHYHLVIDENNDLKIKKIQYWTETFPPDVFASLYASWDAYREKALLALATSYLNAKP
jgi:hypothetical protein